MPRPRLQAEQFVPDTAPVVLLALLDHIQSQGGDGAALCRHLGFSAAELRGGRLVSRRQAWRMIRLALQMTGQPDLGLEVGRSREDYCFGLPRQAMAGAANLAEVIDIGLRYAHQCGAMLDLGCEIHGDEVHLIAEAEDSDPSVLRFLLEELFASLRQFGSELIGAMIVPRRVELRYARPAHAGRYPEFLGVMPAFEQSGNRLVLDAALLRQPLRPAPPAPQVLDLLEQRSQLRPADMLQALEQLLIASAPEPLSVDRAAQLLGLSPRTLRRRLQESGTSFRKLLDRVRAEQAQRLLLHQGLSVAAASEQLGFSEVRAFRHAFQRWNGVSPGKLRQGATG